VDELVNQRLGLVVGLFIVMAMLLPVSAQPSQKRVLQVEVSGFISAATADHVSAAIAEASSPGYTAVLLQLDTFGGAGDSMFKIIETIQSSPVPVIGFVYPAGRQALSAGTYILLATDYAAMAPFTTIGSGQPVLGTTPTNETKLINALVGKMESFAKLHGRNETSARDFVTKNINFGPEEALRNHVIEEIAQTPRELLEKADGLQVSTISGVKTLDTANAEIIKFPESVRVSILRILSDPTISSLLLGIGTLVLIIGLTSPGFGAEIGGAILIILGLIGLGFNINLLALLLIVVGAGLMVYELYVSTLGALLIAGLITFGIGMALLVTMPPSPQFVSSVWVEGFLRTILASMLAAGGFFSFVIYKLLPVVRRKKSVIQPTPSGEGRAVDDISEGMVGYVVIGGEYWQAKATKKVSAGSRVKTIGTEGMVLLVEPIE
jgi:membrane-bound serine protease (ClpP class)